MRRKGGLAEFVPESPFAMAVLSTEHGSPKPKGGQIDNAERLLMGSVRDLGRTVLCFDGCQILFSLAWALSLCLTVKREFHGFKTRDLAIADQKTAIACDR